MRAPFLFMLGILASCASPEQQIANQQRAAQAGIERCRAMGAVTQEQFFQCRLQQQQADAARSEAYGRQMQALGTAMIMGTPQQQPTYPRSVTCRSIPEGVMVRTVCN